MAAERLPARLVEELGEYFHRNGYVRRQNARRVVKEGPREYKKGDEIRLVAETKKELRTIRRLLRDAGFEPGSPFEKGRQYRQPLYGREPVARFLKLVGGERRRRKTASKKTAPPRGKKKQRSRAAR